ncbi:23S rRNA (uracil(1939)-C(5))-methyltransferase RlmD [Nitrosospira sp. Nsp13]|jgi:23S rRNA (uracil1939-C5)-methyltransferase|uniref:23S rRNA (uracil(1939)-C(5))-methyltransferase RlmD n=1 Tax=Nitrosospira sp. Nsp13 TaxID=1855332 RepID=UPI00088FF387|nr:23S rRNA (uracil(1939)-C(5))-methyltransferase RlmD [Nitrosospira sp. Nsp13]SCX95386.1 23S rRNA m(5)U-1939 methyltransferase [Nitrosospira sp. Nsp13]
MIAPVTIESLDQEGRGVAHAEGKVIFIEGALPGEVVTYNPYRKKSNFEMAQVGQVLRPGYARVTPQCRHFGICGGCSLQHMDARAQVAAKQRVLEDNLKHIGKVEPELILPAVYGAAWGYRYRARLSVRYVAKKGGVLVGFHEKRSSFVADMRACEVMPSRISRLILPLRELVGSLSIRDRIPQIEVSLGEDVDVLVLRILEPLTSRDEALLKAFADRHHIQFFLQPEGSPQTAYPFYPENAPELNYTLPEFDIVMPFHPTEFTQVNPAMNRILVRRALNLLDPRPAERIADLFCGLGNFTLPIARRGAHVAGYEGSVAMVRRAGENARRNGLARNTQFIEANLFEINEAWMQGQGYFDKMLIDPPREGAIAAVNSLGEGSAAPPRIVYVSCNPATLARDAGVLVHGKGYVLKAAGVVNMFPHTAHVESIALFEKAAV